MKITFEEILNRIPQHLYGVGEAKTIDQLRQEFESGESIFSIDGKDVLREVWVLRLHVEALVVKNSQTIGYVLKESYQKILKEDSRYNL